VQAASILNELGSAFDINHAKGGHMPVVELFSVFADFEAVGGVCERFNPVAQINASQSQLR
jgi:hypothetical protein